MKELKKLEKHINYLCRENSLLLEEATEGKFKIFTDSGSGLYLFLNIRTPNDFSFYFLERTYDIVWHGDRSDVHVIISLIFACFLREFSGEISCSLYDMPHPAVEDEIWGRYIMPEQVPSLMGITNWSDLTEGITKIILGLVIWRSLFWQNVGCPCEQCLKENSILNNYKEEMPFELDHNKNKIFKKTIRLNYGGRLRPDWSYFYDMQNELTVIKSEHLAMFLEALDKINKNKQEIVKGVSGRFIVQVDLKNYISNRDLAELRKLYKSLKSESYSDDFKLFPLENMILSVSMPYIIALGRLAGIHKFKVEREKLRVRHNRESEILFPIALFEWSENLCPEKFENLIKALLEREPNVTSVRKASPVNQGDMGRDLLIEWNVPTDKKVSENQPPTSLRTVVGQCKTSNKSVGKNKVLDIRDTVELHNAQGYFLAVSSQISSPLTQKLEDLKSKGVWTEWWNRDDIEIRLSKNQDLLPAFVNLVKAKHQIKFVDIDGK